MLQVYTSVNQTVDENSPVAFNITKISTGCTSALTNSNTITLRKSGFYEVSFNGTGVTTAAGNTSVQLYANGTKVADALSSAYTGATSQNGALSFKTLIQVRPSCAMINNNITLQVINTGTEATFSNVNLIITKLG